jgi:hypothetical protein
MEQRRQRVQLATDHHNITGTITLPADEHRGRLSDVVNSRERDFVPLTDVSIEPAGGGQTERRRFTAVSRQRIVLISEID